MENMRKNTQSRIEESAQINDSFIAENGVKIWTGARVQKSNLETGVSIGNDSIIVDSRIGERCEIGRRNIISHVSMGKGSSTQGNTTLRYCSVGNYCAIAWNVTVGAPNHDTHRLAMAEIQYIFEGEEREHMQSFDDLECKIGNDVWIAAGAHVMRGVSISNGGVVAANAVVTKDVPSYAIVAGVPAKIIGYRFRKDQIERLERIRWWDFSDELLAKSRRCFDGYLTDDIIRELERIKES